MDDPDALIQDELHIESFAIQDPCQCLASPWIRNQYLLDEKYLNRWNLIRPIDYSRADGDNNPLCQVTHFRYYINTHLQARTNIIQSISNKKHSNFPIKITDSYLLRFPFERMNDYVCGDHPGSYVILPFNITIKIF